LPRKPQVGVWITTDGKEIEVHPKDGKKFSLGELQEFVGGYIERVTLPNGRSMFVNEEGKLKGLKTNIAATIISGLYPHDVISGPVLRLRRFRVYPETLEERNRDDQPEDEMTRSYKDYAIEHGEYLATAAESFLRVLNEEAKAEESGESRNTEIINDHWMSLTSAIYEFRKRAKRARELKDDGTLETK
jgi:hypothetical protein